MSVEVDPPDTNPGLPRTPSLPDEAHTTEPVADTPAAATTTTRAPRPPMMWVAWALVVVFAITTVGATLAWRSASQDDNARAAVHDAATGLAINLVTWEADTLDETAEQLRARGTGDFLDQIDEVITGAKELSAAVDGSSSGEILDVLVDVDGDRALAVVIVRQTLRAAGQEASEEQVMRVELVQADGRWLVDEVELINVPIPIAFGEESPS